MQFLTNTLRAESVNFKQKDHWVRCLAHIMNLAVQLALTSLKADAENSEDAILGHSIVETTNVISKVRRSRFDALSYGCSAHINFLLCSFES